MVKLQQCDLPKHAAKNLGTSSWEVSVGGRSGGPESVDKLAGSVVYASLLQQRPAQTQPPVARRGLPHDGGRNPEEQDDERLESVCLERSS